MNWDWELASVIATWAAAVGAVTCFFSITRLLRFQSRVHKETMASLNEMSATYKQAWAIILEDLNQLRDRIAELENR